MTPQLEVESRIYLIRGHKVMLSHDLAELYGVETRVLVQAVRRNLDRFPEDFMFRLTWEEAKRATSRFGNQTPSQNSRSQIVILRWGENVKYLPFAFTEQGVAMLSSVLRSKQAVQVNIEIMRAFVRLRQILGAHKDLAAKLEALEKKYDAQFSVVFDAIRKLMAPPAPPRPRIGFRPDP
ncbi:MAG: ORF6N domain-containing protein [Elusimicrobia bacterium]|nr:ORF6N domain-containing protein [Elusimicrobiota bacterium]